MYGDTMIHWKKYESMDLFLNMVLNSEGYSSSEEINQNLDIKWIDRVQISTKDVL